MKHQHALMEQDAGAGMPTEDTEGEDEGAADEIDYDDV